MNVISFLGRVGNEPEIKKVGDNDVLEFSIANNVGFGDKQITNWFRCALWGKRATSLNGHISKGKELFVTGELSMRTYTNKDGVEKLSADLRLGAVQFTSGGDRGDSAPPQQQRTTPTDDDGDMPF